MSFIGDATQPVSPMMFTMLGLVMRVKKFATPPSPPVEPRYVPRAQD